MRPQRAAAAHLQEAIGAAESVELLSLDPKETMIGNGKGPFHGFDVLGSVALSTEDRNAVADSVAAAIRASEPRLVACFFPRHGLRIHRGEASEDVVICFECATAYFGSAEPLQRINIEESAESVLNALLDRANVPRSRSSNH